MPSTLDIGASQPFTSNHVSSNGWNYKTWSTLRPIAAGAVLGRPVSIELWMNGGEIYWPHAVMRLDLLNGAGTVLAGGSMTKYWGVAPGWAPLGTISGANTAFKIRSAVYINSSVYTAGDAGAWTAQLNYTSW